MPQAHLNEDKAVVHASKASCIPARSSVGSRNTHIIEIYASPYGHAYTIALAEYIPSRTSSALSSQTDTVRGRLVHITFIVNSMRTWRSAAWTRTNRPR